MLQSVGNCMLSPSIKSIAAPNSNKDEVASRIVSVAIVTLYGLACYAAVITAPASFAIGLAGTMIGIYATRVAVSLAAQVKAIKGSRLYPIIDDCTAIAVAAGTLYLGATVGMTAAKVTLVPALLCTIGGYYLPISVLHEVRALAN